MVHAAASPPRVHVAASDCERIRPGLVAQPVNTVSSLAYCAAGAAVLRNGPRSRGRVSLGLAAIAAGLGSATYHGPGGRAGRAMHDVTAAALAGRIAFALAKPRVGAVRRFVTVGCLTAAVGVHAASRTGRALCRPDSPWQGHALWHLLGAAAVVVVADERSGANGLPPPG